MARDPTVVKELYEHVFGAGEPTARLVAEGSFPHCWTTRYRELLKDAAREWRDEPVWPRELVSAIHYTSWYLDLRYELWHRQTGQRNDQTERDLRSLRSPSEIFLMHGSLLPSETSVTEGWMPDGGRGHIAKAENRLA